MSDWMLRVKDVKKGYHLGQYGGDTFRKEALQRLRAALGKGEAPKDLPICGNIRKNVPKQPVAENWDE